MERSEVRTGWIPSATAMDSRYFFPQAPLVHDCHAAVCLIYLNLGWSVSHNGEYVNGNTNCVETRDTNYGAAERMKGGYSIIWAGPDDLTLRTGLTGVHYINLVMLLPPQSAHPGKRSS
jgi:hypothetical protein